MSRTQKHRPRRRHRPATAGVVALLQNVKQRRPRARPRTSSWPSSTRTRPTRPSGARTSRAQYDGYRRTVDTERTRFGGSEAFRKLDADPRLQAHLRGLRLRDRLQRGARPRLHAVRPGQTRACTKRSSRALPALPRLDHPGLPQGRRRRRHEGLREGLRDAVRGGARSWSSTRSPASTATTRRPCGCASRGPGSSPASQALKAKQGVADYDPNRDATRQEMRSFVCGQCHVEYYFKGARQGRDLSLGERPQGRGDRGLLRQRRASRTGRTPRPAHQVLKAQHPEFEMWSQGIHARAGVACADCHMPYKRVGALKVSDHWVRSPLLNVDRACQTCHPVPEAELQARVLEPSRTAHTRCCSARPRRRRSTCCDAIEAAQEAPACRRRSSQAARGSHRKAQWRLDFVAAENSMGFHAPQELARILGEAIDYARQGEMAARLLKTQRALSHA